MPIESGVQRSVATEVYAVALVLRGSIVTPALVVVELRKWQRYGHSAILLSTGELVEASALHNEVLVHPHTCEFYNYERVLSLDHLGREAQVDIARVALAMRGWKYDYRNARGQAIDRVVEDDPRRVICFVHTGIATCKYLRYNKVIQTVDAEDIERAWRWSRVGIRR